MRSQGFAFFNTKLTDIDDNINDLRMSHKDNLFSKGHPSIFHLHKTGDPCIPVIQVQRGVAPIGGKVNGVTWIQGALNDRRIA